MTNFIRNIDASDFGWEKILCVDETQAALAEIGAKIRSGKERVRVFEDQSRALQIHIIAGSSITLAPPCDDIVRANSPPGYSIAESHNNVFRSFQGHFPDIFGNVGTFGYHAAGKLPKPDERNLIDLYKPQGANAYMMGRVIGFEGANSPIFIMPIQFCYMHEDDLRSIPKEMRRIGFRESPIVPQAASTATK